MDERRTTWELEQRRLITETLMAYCEHVDRNDPTALVTRVFAADGTYELGSDRAVVGREQLARMFAKTLCAFTATSHHLSNVRIELGGEGGGGDGPGGDGVPADDRARAHSNVYAWHRTLDGRRVEIWGRYRDELRRTDEGWRIARRHLSMAGSEGWVDPPFEVIERLPNPVDPPSPTVVRR